MCWGHVPNCLNMRPVSKLSNKNPSLCHLLRLAAPPPAPSLCPKKAPSPERPLSSSFGASIQYYHGNPDIPYPLIPRYGLSWCPVIKGAQILRAQVTISNTSRVVDQATP